CDPEVAGRQVGAGVIAFHVGSHGVADTPGRVDPGPPGGGLTGWKLLQNLQGTGDVGVAATRTPGVGQCLRVQDQDAFTVEEGDVCGVGLVAEPCAVTTHQVPLAADDIGQGVGRGVQAGGGPARIRPGSGDAHALFADERIGKECV